MIKNDQALTELLQAIDFALTKADDLQQHNVAAIMAQAHEIVRAQLLSTIG